MLLSMITEFLSRVLCSVLSSQYSVLCNLWLYPFTLRPVSCTQCMSYFVYSVLHPFMYPEFYVLYPILNSVFCILCFVSCILCPVSCILYPVSCILYHVSCILYPVSCILYPVSCILYPISCILCPAVLYIFMLSVFLSYPVLCIRILCSVSYLLYIL